MVECLILAALVVYLQRQHRRERAELLDRIQHPDRVPGEAPKPRPRGHWDGRAEALNEAVKRMETEDRILSRTTPRR
jgi:hypothetical protein